MLLLSAGLYECSDNENVENHDIEQGDETVH